MIRNVVLVFCGVCLLFSCSNKEAVSIKKVEHFYISSNNAPSIFRMFTEQFDLPVVWDYQDWGGFSSGGVTMGNVVLELIENATAQSKTYYGIALEPNQSLRRTRHYLDSVNISHGSIGKAVQWNTMSLTNLLPEAINLFLCDYHDREFIALDRKKAADELVVNTGGTLGIEFLVAIVIGTPDPIEFENGLAKIPGVIKKGNEFHFSEGPSLKLTTSDLPYFALILKVKSLEKAVLELEELGLETRTTEQGVEVMDNMFSTNITLIEKEVDVMVH